MYIPCKFTRPAAPRNDTHFRATQLFCTPRVSFKLGKGANLSAPSYEVPVNLYLLQNPVQVQYCTLQPKVRLLRVAYSYLLQMADARKVDAARALVAKMHGEECSIVDYE